MDCSKIRKTRMAENKYWNETGKCPLIRPVCWEEPLIKLDERMKDQA
jgi:hypothetical protein